MKRIFLLFLCLLFSALAITAESSGVKPEAGRLEEKYLLGLYAGNGEQILVREDAGQLQIIYRYKREDRDYRAGNVFPLTKERYDKYTVYEAGTLTSAEGEVRFERDKEGHGISCSVGKNRYTRVFFGPEKGEYFSLTPVKPLDELRREAVNAVPPLKGTRQTELTDLRKIPGLQFDLRYATKNNCFGEALYENEKAYLGTEAAAALTRVQKNLTAFGYGLLIWDAYRPWYLTKVASEALPDKYKDILPTPEKGSSHNTGNAVDVSLYELSTGKPVEMISDFDEPSPRQYGSFAGGTSLERWQRNLLQLLMSTEGFNASEMEWWHFEYGSLDDLTLLNVSLTTLP